MKTFLILGGYGNTGRLIAQLLLKYTDCNIIIAGTNPGKADRTCLKFNHLYNYQRTKAVVCDASDKSSLVNAFSQCDFVVIASSTSKYVKNTAEAAIQCNVDYLDIQISADKLNYLNSIKEEIKRRGRIFITDGGFHPGLPAAMVNYANGYYDSLISVNVGSLLLLNWAEYSFSDSTIEEFIWEIKNYSTIGYKNGSWVKLKYSDKILMREFNFPAPYGTKKAYLMFLEEMKELTEKNPGIKEAGFYVQGFNAVSNYIVFPLAAVLIKISEKFIGPLGKFLSWSMKRFSHPPFICIIKLEAEGIKDGQVKKYELTISHEDGYFLTAVPVAAVLMQYIDGLKKPGLNLMAHYPDPARFIMDLKQMGLNISSSDTFLQVINNPVNT